MRSLQPGRPRGASAGRLQGPDCHPALCLPTDVSRCVAERKYTQEQARRELQQVFIPECSDDGTYSQVGGLSRGLAPPSPSGQWLPPRSRRSCPGERTGSRRPAHSRDPSPSAMSFLEGPLPGLRSGAHALSAFLGPPVAASKHPGLHMERVDVITVILFKGNEFLRCPAN